MSKSGLVSAETKARLRGEASAVLKYLRSPAFLKHKLAVGVALPSGYSKSQIMMLINGWAKVNAPDKPAYKTDQKTMNDESTKRVYHCDRCVKDAAFVEVTKKGDTWTVTAMRHDHNHSGGNTVTRTGPDAVPTAGVASSSSSNISTVPPLIPNALPTETQKAALPIPMPIPPKIPVESGIQTTSSAVNALCILNPFATIAWRRKLNIDVDFSTIVHMFSVCNFYYIQLTEAVAINIAKVEDGYNDMWNEQIKRKVSRMVAEVEKTGIMSSDIIVSIDAQAVTSPSKANFLLSRAYNKIRKGKMETANIGIFRLKQPKQYNSAVGKQSVAQTDTTIMDVES